jgi:hypothetical protein
MSQLGSLMPPAPATPQPESDWQIIKVAMLADPQMRERLLQAALRWPSESAAERTRSAAPELLDAYTPGAHEQAGLLAGLPVAVAPPNRAPVTYEQVRDFITPSYLKESSEEEWRETHRDFERAEREGVPRKVRPFPGLSPEAKGVLLALDIGTMLPAGWLKAAAAVPFAAARRVAPKAVAFGTYEATPGIGIGHLPKVAEGTEAERRAFAMDPRSKWEDWRGRDLIYRLFGMRPLPTRPATGMYQAPGGPLEINPGAAARPQIGLAGQRGQWTVDPTSRANMNAAEAVRAYIAAQDAGAWSIPFFRNKLPNSRSLFIPNKGPMTPEQMLRLKELGGQHGLPNIVDYGGGVVMTNFGGRLPEARTLATSLKGGLREKIGEIVPGSVPRRVQLDAGYIPYTEAWRAGEGSGAVTRELQRHLQEAAAALAKLDASPELRAAALAHLERDTEIAARTNQPVRADLQRAREIIAKEGFSGLWTALERGVAIPAVVLAPLMALGAREPGESGQSDDYM